MVDRCVMDRCVVSWFIMMDCSCVMNWFMLGRCMVDSLVRDRFVVDWFVSLRRRCVWLQSVVFRGD